MAGVKQQDLVIIKSLAAPPQVVKDTLAAAMILLGESNPKDFRTAKVALAQVSDNSLIKKMASLDVESIKIENAKKAQDLIAGVTAERVRSNCAAVVGIFCWVQEVLDSVEKRTGSLSTTKSDTTT